jgi:hypothetical protein
LTIWQSRYAPKTGILWQNLSYFFSEVWELKVVILHIFSWRLNQTKQTTVHKKILLLWLSEAVFVRQFSLFMLWNSHMHSKKHFLSKLIIYVIGRKLKMLHCIFLFDPLATKNYKKVCTLGSRAIFVKTIFTILIKKQLFLD